MVFQNQEKVQSTRISTEIDISDDFQVDENVQNTGHTKEVENCLNQEKAAPAEGEENAIDLNWTMTTTDWERIFYLNTCHTWTDLVMMPHVRILRRERVSQTSPS